MRGHSHSTVRKLSWLGPLAVLVASANAAVATAAEPPADVPAGAPECKSTGVTVSFVTGSAEIDQNGRGALAGVATWLHNGERRTVRLEGYTDRSGNPAANERLSAQRAQAAKDFLLGRGIEPDRIMVFAHGEEEDPRLTGADARVVAITACDVPKKFVAEATPEEAAAATPVDEPVALAEPVMTSAPIPVPPQKPVSGLGVEATIGAGAMGFIDQAARSVTGTGVTWDARLMFGSRLPIAVEGAYVGSVQNIDALGLSSDSLLLGNGVEGTLRINLTQMRVQPYLFGGIGWTHYQLNNTATNTSSVLAKDDIGTVPMGAGVSARLGRAFILDVRGTYRATFDDDMMRAQTSQDNTLQSWSASARMGFEF